MKPFRILILDRPLIGGNPNHVRSYHNHSIKISQYQTHYIKIFIAFPEFTFKNHAYIASCQFNLSIIAAIFLVDLLLRILKVRYFWKILHFYRYLLCRPPLRGVDILFCCGQRQRRR